MWKFVTRGIRETLERRLECRTNIYSQIIRGNNTKNEVKKKSLSCNQECIGTSYSAYNNEFCESTRSKGAKDNNEGTKWNTKHNWAEAVGWAFDKAVDELNDVHKLVMGEYELHFGLKALDEKRYNDAMRHFSAGTKYSSVESMFNLGLCYELGLGTLIDHAKAARYYDQAAKKGHADAMYNLGVFHAQGKGDLILDLDRARLYFKKAAQLGQIQAQQALDLENITVQSKSNDKYSLKVDDFHREKSSKKLLAKLENYTNIYNNQSHAECNTNSSKCQSVDKVKNPTEIFLDYLGLTEPNIVPVTISLDECRVQC
ncbi:uncharacterized protein LOC118440535 isoform X2 [Vespa mandarinia]|uniref:uncharacterized protein LOC118440535 isoform X2 n=1 Tax=Vespa mandarinia TaxID=7446 RepID=UPI00160925B1|nr:uncharacterized protein LOC118440535 isoform X2 [Vespa mandarinia]